MGRSAGSSSSNSPFRKRPTAGRRRGDLARRSASRARRLAGRVCAAHKPARRPADRASPRTWAGLAPRRTRSGGVPTRSAPRRTRSGGGPTRSAPRRTRSGGGPTRSAPRRDGVHRRRRSPPSSRGEPALARRPPRPGEGAPACATASGLFTAAPDRSGSTRRCGRDVHRRGRHDRHLGVCEHGNLRRNGVGAIDVDGVPQRGHRMRVLRRWSLHV
jgi:hypothetical protein